MRYGIAALLLTLCVALAGCKTGAQTGALAGGGIGALAGQAIGGNTQATLIGAAVGAGVGYVIGNEKDKAHAQKMSRANEGLPPTHSEVGSLGGTRWNLVSLNPRDVAPPYTSKVIEFRPDGRVITTTTKPDGSVEVFDESYRVVGDTLIVNKPGYLINARHRIAGNQLIVNCDRFSAVLDRIGTTSAPAGPPGGRTSP
jgi:hypothetical protein